MGNTFWTPIGASLLAAATTTAGLLTVRRFKDWALRNTVHFASFAAGVLLAVSLLHLVPGSLVMSGTAPTFVYAGYLAIHVLSRFLDTKVCDRDPARDYGFGLVALIGIGLHSFLDGTVYSISFEASNSPRGSRPRA